MDKLMFFLYAFIIQFVFGLCVIINLNQNTNRSFSELSGEELTKSIIIGVLGLTALILFRDAYNVRFKEISKRARITLSLFSLFVSVITAVLLVGDCLIS
ncbi:hypothetical protein NLX67_15950 [Domibacillus sp. A3M-37]|uniref:hypothetical protein n=1 Tax=Domibacillus sp. A3M-37 TaxID=2962037 RepID=UPI0020B83981|nr:hypothetical protein [Domibacillus sp. A3M-37]MCP3763865.1 hypothetical protein [Domibacillus sp. A3M-37]